jgi:hypothetical protein
MMARLLSLAVIMLVLRTTLADQMSQVRVSLGNDSLNGPCFKWNSDRKSFVAKCEGSNIELFSNASNPLRMMGTTVRLPEARGVPTVDKDAVLHDFGAYSILVKTQRNGWQAIITVKDPSAPLKYAFKFEDGVKLVQARELGLATDEWFVTQGSDAMVSIASPWARDSSGKNVDTSFKVKGNALVQTILHNEGHKYPIVTDPDFFFFLNCGAAIAEVVLFSFPVLKAIKALGSSRKVAEALVKAVKAVRNGSRAEELDAI